MFGIGLYELIIIFGIIFLMFGARKLPELGSSIGRAIRNFRTSYNEADAIDVTPQDEGAGVQQTDQREKDPSANQRDQQ